MDRDQISFLVFPPENSIFTQEAAASMVGKETTLDGTAVKIVAAELDSGAIRVTVEGTSREIAEVVRRGSVTDISVSEPPTKGA